MKGTFISDQSLIILLISNLINKLRLHQFLGTKTTETNKSLKTDANVALLMSRKRGVKLKFTVVLLHFFDCAVYMHCNGRWRHGRTWAVKENVKVIQS